MKKKGNILTIAKKEFNRFFRDKGMVVSTLILPGLIIYVMYTFMGNALTDNFSVKDDFKPSIYIEGESEAITGMFTNVCTIKEPEAGTTVDDIKEKMTNKNYDIHALVILPENFDADVAAYDKATSDASAPNIEVYYNSASKESSNAMTVINEVLASYENSLINKFDINAGDSIYDLATKEDTSGQMFASMLPMLMMIFLFTGCMALAPESIAGEKERGTIATLLITPMKRSELVIGKIISLACISLLSGLSSFIGIFASMPSLMGGADSGMNVDIYGVKEFALLFGVILSTVLVIIGLICIVSTYAKSVKQAGTLITPFMMLSMVIGITSMFGNGAATDKVMYVLPLYNSVQSMVGIFLLDYSMINILITIVSNVCYMVLFTVIITKMFNSEKIVFNK